MYLPNLNPVFTQYFCSIPQITVLIIFKRLKIRNTFFQFEKLQHFETFQFEKLQHFETAVRKTVAQTNISGAIFHSL